MAWANPVTSRFCRRDRTANSWVGILNSPLRSNCPGRTCPTVPNTENRANSGWPARHCSKSAEPEATIFTGNGGVDRRGRFTKAGAGTKVTWAFWNSKRLGRSSKGGLGPDFKRTSNKLPSLVCSTYTDGSRKVIAIGMTRSPSKLGNWVIDQKSNLTSTAPAFAWSGSCAVGNRADSPKVSPPKDNPVRGPTFTGRIRASLRAADKKSENR